MNPEQFIVSGTLVMLTFGVIRHALDASSPKRVIAGSIGVALVASLLTMGGPELARVAAGIIGIAVFVTVVIEGKPVWDQLNKVVKG